MRVMLAKPAAKAIFFGYILADPHGAKEISVTIAQFRK